MGPGAVRRSSVRLSLGAGRAWRHFILPFMHYVTPLHTVHCKAMHTIWFMERSLKGGHASYSILGLVLVTEEQPTLVPRAQTCFS